MLAAMTRFSTPTLTGDNSRQLPEFDNPPADPVALFGEWFDFAVANAVIEPGAFTLATVDDEGCPSTRTLLTKDWDERGLLFVTSAGRVKGPGLQHLSPVAATYYWREFVQQVQLRGVIEVTCDEESDALFAARPLAARAAAVASQQSETLIDEAELREQILALTIKGEDVARPPRWRGFRLIPETIEFWQGGTDRFHRRLLYTRTPDGWVPSRLQP